MVLLGIIWEHTKEGGEEKHKGRGKGRKVGKSNGLPT
jgi:hypothetical protein